MKLRAITKTEDWLRDGASKYGDEEILYKVLPQSLKVAEPTDSDTVAVIEGWASTKDVDLGDDIVDPIAFANTLSEYQTNGLMLFMHDWYGVPIGKFDEVSIKENGLWVKGRVLKTQMGSDVGLLIKNGVLNALSIGFAIREANVDEETGVRTITDLKLYEISVVNAGMNPHATFTQAKSLGINLNNENSSDGGGTKPKRSPQIMDLDKLKTLDKVEEMVGKHGTALDTVSEEVKNLQANLDEQAKLIKLGAEKNQELLKGRITTDEFNTFVGKVTEDFNGVHEAIQKAQKAAELKAEQEKRVPWLEMLHKEAAMSPMRNDNGEAYGDLQQKAYTLFQRPVSYKNSGEAGDNLKRLRTVSDQLVMVDAYMRGLSKEGKMRYRGPSQLKTYHLFREVLEMVDPVFAKAMYSTATGYGDEWVPEAWSAELYDLYRLNTNVEALIGHFDMPTNPFNWPIKSSAATAYIAGEAAVNNPDEITKSRFGTSKVTFTTETFAVCIPVSPELLEDAIINVAGEIQGEMVTALATGYESMLINGDDTATHRDTQASYTNNVDMETYEDGLRFLAVDRSASFDTQSSTANVGDATTAFAAADVRYLRRLMGVYGVDPSKVVYVTSITPYFYMLNMAQNTSPGTYGGNATWASGKMDTFDGCKVVITSQLVETMGTTGLYNSASTHKGILAFRPDAFRIGERRGITVGYEMNQRTQQMSFVATMRKSFKTLAPSTLDPCAYGYNIE